MIKRIKISQNDKINILNRDSTTTFDLENVDFKGLVVNKPWGYEYLMFDNKEVAIWLLYIKNGHSTSSHCHPKKKTSLVVISGDAICTTLNEKFNLSEKDGLNLDKGVFHKTEAVSEDGIFLMEIETPSDKTDLFRLKDNYKRELKGYTAKKNITEKIYNYHYQYLEDKENTKEFGKHKIFIREYYEKNKLFEDIEKIKPDICVIISGELNINGDIFNEADLVEIDKLNECQIERTLKILFLKKRDNLIKLSDYVITFLQKRGVNDVFLISGGNIMHLLESIRIKKMNYLCNHNEQAVSSGADGYARMKNKLGFAMVTSGPGATNAITGVAGAWIDSIPLLIISGQSHHDQIIKGTKLRQLGVQEMDIVTLVKPITKYSVLIEDPKKIKYELEKALYLAESGRKGPVWIDIPVNFQLSMIEEDELESFVPPKEEEINESIEEKVSETIKLIKNSKRPIILLGNGVRLSNSGKEFLEMAEKLSIPIVTSRNANDLIWEDHPLFAGRPGSFGQRPANFAIQNSDLLLAVGSRIALALTGWAFRDFAREAKKIVVDIDSSELKKPIITPDIAIRANAKDFIKEMMKQLGGNYKKDFIDWKEKIKYWREKYPVCLPEYKNTKGYINSYNFIDILCEELNEDDVVVTDMGMSFQCTMQAMKLKKGQRLFTQSGLAGMGYGLPAAIGACIANNKKRIICISGDGGIQMNIQEMQTIKHHNLPIKLFIFNNNGYSSIRETQDFYFKGHIASDTESGVSMPDITKIARAYGIESMRLENQDDLRTNIKEVLNHDGPVVCDLNIAVNQPISPKQGAFNRPDGRTVPRPIEDMLPFLDREQFEKEMIIEPIPFDPYKGEDENNINHESQLKIKNSNAILFDFDGVLADTMEDNFLAWEKAFMDFNIKIKKEDYYPLEGMKLINVAKTLCDKYGLEIDFEKLPILKNKFYLENNKFRFYDMVEELIDKLKTQGRRMAIVSASPKEKLEKTVPKEFLDKFEVIISGDDCSMGKPHPEPYLNAMNKLGLLPEKCVVVENAPLGISSAKAAGISCVALTTTLDNGHLKEADKIFNSHKELVEFLL